ncbi:Rossmann-fold NAD(P)-binding domain-containing protein [Rubritepida flocculans]|uniref:nucleoside-diphosphate sugar epimerase n=1 Tax=Rubritepida flocculans TaxID=182403 RepID=UPI000482E22F|nr:nucleoside-diphosphate sugar epimerase [Rubritepida flocculans]
MGETPRTLTVVGLGYTGRAVAARAAAGGWRVRATARDPAALSPPPGVEVVEFAAPGWVEAATHLLVTAPPGEAGDPVWAAHAARLSAAPLRWVGYLSTTGVYGDRGGGWVEEDTPPAPGQPRSLRRREAERQWEALASRAAVDLFRTGGIYGPGRSALDEARAGTARRILKPGHAFGRIHVQDIVRAVLAAAARPPAPGLRVLHLVDDEPAEPARVVEEACRLLGLPPPPETPFAEAWARMSEMARSFWAENRRVANARTKAALGLDWAFPSYREGLAAILAEQRAQGAAEQGEVRRG